MAKQKQTMPAIALYGLTIFPNVLIHFDVGRENSINALEEAMASSTPVFLVGQRTGRDETPTVDSLYNVGTIAMVQQLLRIPGDNVRVMVEGVSRGNLSSIDSDHPYLLAEVTPIPEGATKQNSSRTEALIRSTYELFYNYSELLPRTSPELLAGVIDSDDPGYIADYIAQNISMRNSDKQLILEELRPTTRLSKLNGFLAREVEILTLDQDIQSAAQAKMSDHQREYYLREQIKVIQEELHEDDFDEADDYRSQIRDLKCSEEVREKLYKELAKLNRQSQSSSDATLLRNYIEVCLELPWEKSTAERVDVTKAKKQLDKDHFGLLKVKERILEYLAVRQLVPDLKGQTLCLVGPPGVGKTSIATSIATALGRDFARISLGGVSDEAEIRGHRKTYIGAMAGRIINAVKQAGSNNPVILLDEIDKLGRDHRGDPSSALLEVLDGEQNSSFRDHFLELPFDLSQVIFITTANTTSTISRPLLDRMEIIELPSYTDEEKLKIAKKYLLPKEMERHGIEKSVLKVTDGGMRSLISGYTRESGVRNLQRQIAGLCRKVAMKVVSEEGFHVRVGERELVEFLGGRRYHKEPHAIEKRIGIVNGLAWTSVGGELLEVEVNVVDGTGKLNLTGNLGDVMKESAQTAVSLIRARVDQLDIDKDFHKDKDIHIHFPEGAVPKDGPSAGIAITTAIVSALSNTSVRAGVAMTGEITLRGRVLPIGGLREKSMAALRNNIELVLIPKENEKDLEEIDQAVRNRLQFYLVDDIDQVLSTVLLPKPKRGRKPGRKAIEPSKIRPLPKDKSIPLKQ
ncbi:MAG: endopeptidase La [Eubacteriales bacterium]